MHQIQLIAFIWKFLRIHIKNLLFYLFIIITMNRNSPLVFCAIIAVKIYFHNLTYSS